jgi:hypothetical protein
MLLPAWFLLQCVVSSWPVVGEKADVATQLMAYVVVAVFGFVVTDRLIPNIQQYTLRKGICGKDMGKRGTPLAETPMYVLTSRRFNGRIWFMNLIVQRLQSRSIRNRVWGNIFGMPNLMFGGICEVAPGENAGSELGVAQHLFHAVFGIYG